MEVFTDHEHYGFPEDGGLNNQPSLYIHALNCIRTARDNAEYLERQDESYKAHLKEEEAESERIANEAGAGMD